MARRTQAVPPSEVTCHLDELLADRGMTLADLAKQVDITYANLSVLKNNRGRAIRFSTLAAICRALNCSVGELLEVLPDGG
ncbi:helix-turn-helix domain-containing protein [Ornithinimicrobium pratense]|uniref:Helix-turn-helix transcriptional regulator n=1 Tax=Ornithinimicrobium pratense TaxID=2593973 RepID=A0A5J6V9H5_9MICO|nr:helix-turn-helix transcriptional regulator [Ornithinimicrobium pratense]QFG69994.1 helix-turn-helix transcriptional regulator [Ornithinimicrobium pratense]